VGALWGGLSLALAAPWFVKSWLYTGNPVYPFFYSLFGGRYWSAENAAGYAGNQAQFGFGKTPLDLLLSPWQVTMQGGQFTEYAFPAFGQFAVYGLSPAFLGLLLAAPLMAPPRGLSRPAVLLTGFGLAGYVFWFFLMQQTRYLIPVLPAFAVVGAEALVGASRLVRAAGGALVAASAAWGLYVAAAGIAAPALPVVTGRVTPEEHVTRTLRMRGLMPAIAFINRETPPDAKVALFDETRGFYLDRPYVWATPNHSTLLPWERYAGRGRLARPTSSGAATRRCWSTRTRRRGRDDGQRWRSLLPSAGRKQARPRLRGARRPGVADPMSGGARQKARAKSRRAAAAPEADGASGAAAAPSAARRTLPARRLLLVFLATSLLLSVGFAARVPLDGNPDEHAHLDYIRLLVEERGFVRFIPREQLPPGAPSRDETHQSPLYYLLCVPVYALAGGSVFVLRLVAALLQLATIVVAFRAVRDLFPERPELAAGAAAFVAFLPTQAQLAGAINNDGLATLVAVAMFWRLGRLVRGGEALDVRRETLFLGALLGLGLLTKLSVLQLLPAVLLACLIAARAGAVPDQGSPHRVRDRDGAGPADRVAVAGAQHAALRRPADARHLPRHRAELHAAAGDGRVRLGRCGVRAQRRRALVRDVLVLPAAGPAVHALHGSPARSWRPPAGRGGSWGAYRWWRGRGSAAERRSSACSRRGVRPARAFSPASCSRLPGAGALLPAVRSGRPVTCLGVATLTRAACRGGAGRRSCF
jgi:hypothetical protein